MITMCWNMVCLDDDTTIDQPNDELCVMNAPAPLHVANDIAENRHLSVHTAKKQGPCAVH
jgi:hypothetical protein